MVRSESQNASQWLPVFENIKKFVTELALSKDPVPSQYNFFLNGGTKDPVNPVHDA